MLFVHVACDLSVQSMQCLFCSFQYTATSASVTGEWRTINLTDNDRFSSDFDAQITQMQIAAINGQKSCATQTTITCVFIFAGIQDVTTESPTFQCLEFVACFG